MCTRTGLVTTATNIVGYRVRVVGRMRNERTLVVERVVRKEKDGVRQLSRIGFCTLLISILVR